MSTMGEPEGVGLKLVFDEGDSPYPIVSGLVRGSAAEACGRISIQDQLTEIEGFTTEKMPLSRVRDLMLGPRGSEVNLS
eukprot:CAMPEP_0113718460 /NCGR_PEP_ID=MMETSP0038_2-20120614/35215_1 /TAXON_ID=2898 /ORGANISM="Cryptomonas paramecium" /LENGTH=78 /DNA_ID=CAMNT_0000646611 /DNA_START=142 /DNA_END=374 /DNA_ORIENTATION=- /assembly_acc=CAM_ASM_000170